MAVESPVNSIADLNPLWPTGSEPKSAGDDHLRNLKDALRKSFAGFTGAVLVTGVDGGAANAYTLTPATPVTAYSEKMLVLFVPTATNTGASTLAISGMAAKPIIDLANNPVVAGDLVSGVPVIAISDGVHIQLMQVTKHYIDTLIVANTLPGVSDTDNADTFYHTDGAVGGWKPVDGRGSPVANLGNSGSGAVVLAYSDAAEAWTLTANGSFTLSTTGWPAGRLSGGLLKLSNGGSTGWTSTGITWVKADGTETTSFGSSGIILKTSGTDRIALYTFGDGVVYGKLA